jgi:hypothetical protein
VPSTAGFARNRARGGQQPTRACGYALATKGHDTRAIHGWLGVMAAPGALAWITSYPF